MALARELGNQIIWSDNARQPGHPALLQRDYLRARALAKRPWLFDRAQ